MSDEELLETIECTVYEISSINGRHEALLEHEGILYRVVLDDRSFAHACRAMMYGLKVRLHHLVEAIG